MCSFKTLILLVKMLRTMMLNVETDIEIDVANMPDYLIIELGVILVSK